MLLLSKITTEIRMSNLSSQISEYGHMIVKAVYIYMQSFKYSFLNVKVCFDALYNVHKMVYQPISKILFSNDLVLTCELVLAQVFHCIWEKLRPNYYSLQGNTDIDFSRHTRVIIILLSL